MAAVTENDHPRSHLLGRIGDACLIAPCTWLGDISYSLYLVHYPILGALAMTWIYGGGHGIVENLALFVVVGGALSLLVASGFHRLFERGGYVGVGLDAYGNFYNDGEFRGTGCPAGQRSPTSQTRTDRPRT